MPFLSIQHVEKPTRAASNKSMHRRTKQIASHSPVPASEPANPANHLSDPLIPAPHDIPSTINDILEQSFSLVNSARKNKTQVNKLGGLIKQVAKALGGADQKFIIESEFHSDLKETLHKIYCHIFVSVNRQKVVQLMMAKKDNQLFEEMQTQIDVLCGRIFLAYACRIEIRRKSNNGPRW